MKNAALDCQQPQRKPSKGNGNRPIDHSHLQRYTLGDRQAEHEILQLFASQLPQLVEQLQEAANQNDACAWLRAAHTIKGAAQAVGASPLAQFAEQAEKKARTHSQFNISELMIAVEAVMAHIKQLTQHPPDKLALSRE